MILEWFNAKLTSKDKIIEKEVLEIESITSPNKTQYIHSNKPNIENNDLTNEINNLIKELEKEKYNIVSNDIDWNIYENADKDTKIAAFTPIKYGMCWYE